MSWPSRRFTRWLLPAAALAAAVAVAWPHARAAYHLHAAGLALDGHDPATAKAHLDVCARAWPRSPRVHLLAARAARQAGAFEEADRRLDLCLELGGNREEANLERLLLEVQQDRLSLLTDTRIQELIDSGHARLNEVLDVASQAYLRAYRLDSARYCLDRWLERRPDDLDARLRRGWVMERLFQHPEAAADYREALARHPESAAARMRLAQMLLHLNEPAEARKHFEHLAESDRSPPVVAGLAAALRAVGQPEKAYEVLTEGLQAHEKEAPLRLERARAALDLRRLADAEADLRKAAALAPDDYQVNYQLALCLRRLGKAEEAEAAQKKADRINADQKLMFELSERLQARPYDPDVRGQIGQLMLRNGETREGVLWLQSALGADPGFVPAHKALAEHFEKAKQPELAAKHRRSLAGGGAGDGKRP